MSASVQSLLWWSDDQLTRLNAYLEQGLAHWRKVWGIGASKQGSITCLRAHEHCSAQSTRQWHALLPCTGTDLPVRISLQSPPEDALFAAMFGERRASVSHEANVVARQLAQEVWEDCCATLRMLFQPEMTGAAPERNAMLASVDAPPERDLRSWSGALRIDVTECGFSALLHVEASCAETLMRRLSLPSAIDAVPRSSDPMPVVTALENKPLRLHATFDPVELELGILQSLAPGDVIRLTHPLDRPLAFVVEGGSTVCAGYLGQLGGVRALELDARNTQPTWNGNRK